MTLIRHHSFGIVARDAEEGENDEEEEEEEEEEVDEEPKKKKKKKKKAAEAKEEEAAQVDLEEVATQGEPASPTRSLAELQAEVALKAGTRTRSKKRPDAVETRQQTSARRSMSGTRTRQCQFRR